MKEESIDAVLAPPIPPSSRKAELLAMLTILIMVFLLVLGNARRGPRAGNANPVEDLRMQLLAQEAIALKSVFPARPAAGLADPGLRVIQELDLLALGAQDRIRVAILVAYLQGTEPALSRLKAISAAGNSELQDDLDVLEQIFNNRPVPSQSEQFDRLTRRYGYFGSLALAAFAGKDTDAGKSIENGARRVLIVLVFLALSLVALLFVSLAMCAAAIVFWWIGKIRAEYRPEKLANSAYVEAFALYMVLFVGLGLFVRLLGLSSLNWTWLAWLIMPAVILWIIRRSRSDQDWRSALGWYAGRGWLQEAAAGIGGYLACMPIIAIGVGITLILVRVTGNVPRDALAPLLRGNPLALYGLACVFAPVLEETMFRGALFHYLRGRWGWLASAAIVSFIFAVIHPQGWVAVPALGTIALALAALREWRGSIIASMTAHAFNNFLAVTFALLLLRNS
jgi:membrane protease YdiL (CAAX protease family)